MKERGEYRGIYTVLLDGPDYQKLKPGARLMLLTLKIKLGSSGIGVVSGMLGALAENTGMSVVQTTDALSELEQAGWVNTESNIIWLVNGMRYEPSITSQNQFHRASVLGYLTTLPRLKIVDDFKRYYADWLQIEAPPVVEGGIINIIEPAKVTTISKPRSKPSVTTWVAEGTAWWNENIGTIAFARFGTALKPLVDKYTWERVFPVLQTWAMDGDAKTVRVEWFAQNGVRLIEKAGTRHETRKPQWQQDEYDAGMAVRVHVQEGVKAYMQTLNGSSEEWWTRMKAEAKSKGRHALVYAHEQIPRQG